MRCRLIRARPWRVDGSRPSLRSGRVSSEFSGSYWFRMRAPASATNFGPLRGFASMNAPASLPSFARFFDAPELAGFDARLKPALAVILSRRCDDVGVAMTQFVASFVHPDMVCNLAMMECLCEDDKQAALSFFEHALREGLSLEEQGALLHFVQPFIVSALGGPAAH